MEIEKSAKAITVKDKVLEYLKRFPESAVKDITDNINKTYGMNLSNVHISVTLYNLRKDNLVQKEGFGHYSLKGFSKDGEKASDNGQKLTPVLSGEDMHTDKLIPLKEEFGREKTLRILKYWIKLLE